VYYERCAGEGDEYLNPKAFARLYRLGNLQVRRRRRRHRARFVRGVPAVRATHPNEGWALDFVADRLLHGRKLRGMTECAYFIEVRAVANDLFLAKQCLLLTTQYDGKGSQDMQNA
jgi:hypothetical protein